jgi:hypothetical protein
LEQRPNITVSPEVHGERSRLIVRNTGGPGDFTARGRVRASSPEPELYTMYWESMTGVSNHIDGDGGTGSIVVAEKSQAKVYVSDAVEKSYSKGDLVLFKAGEDGMERFPVFSGKSRRIVEGEDERTVYTYVERCIVEVAITATPSLRKKWGTNRYLCEIKDGELKLCETDLLVPDVSE